jgi:hypothetical protein
MVSAVELRRHYLGNHAVLAALAVAAAGGGVTDLKTTIAVTSADMKDALEKAKSLAPKLGSVVLS